MAGINDDGVYDAALDRLALADAIHICSAEPANHAAIAAVSLGVYNVTAGNGNAYTHADGDTSGRKTTLGALTGTNATATGTATDIAATDGTTMQWRRDLASNLNVNSGQEFQINAFDVEEFRDTAPE